MLLGEANQLHKLTKPPWFLYFERGDKRGEGDAQSESEKVKNEKSSTCPY
jgi:hypothetical protein